MEGVDTSQDVEFYEHTQTRWSGRTRKRTNRYKTEAISLILHVETIMNKEQINKTITKAITDEQIDVFLPEPKHERDLKNCTPIIRKRWIAVIKKEVINLIENDTFKKGQIQPTDKPIPTMIVFKAKVTS